MTRRETRSETTLGGRYRLLRRIGGGGMGVVWEADDAVLSRRVAVKVLPPELAADDRFVERFRREARAAAGLTHPNVAQVYDYGEDGPTRFIVMELVPGETLAERLRRGGPLEPDEAARIGAEAADALEAAHRAGIVHRDVKPENIMLTPSAEVKVMDFGIAAAAQYSSLTTAGSLLGTATYMSPEHASGSLVTGASDVYSLAVVLYEMLTGRPPFAMETPVATALAHVNAEPEPISAAVSGVPPKLAETVQLGLAKDPSRRPESAAAFAAMLRGDGGAGKGAAPRAASPTRPLSSDRTIPLPVPTPTRRLAPATVPLSPVGATGTARLPRTDPSSPRSWSSVPPCSCGRSSRRSSAEQGRARGPPGRPRRVPPPHRRALQG